MPIPQLSCFLEFSCCAGSFLEDPALMPIMLFHVFGSVNKAGNKVAQEVGIAQDVFGLLKGYRVESHVNG